MSEKVPEEDPGLAGLIVLLGIVTILLGWVFVEWQTYVVAVVIAVAAMVLVIVWASTSPAEPAHEVRDGTVVQIGTLSLRIDHVKDDLEINAEELGHLVAAELQKQLRPQLSWIEVQLAGTRRGSWILDLALFAMVTKSTIEWLAQYERGSKGLTAVLSDLKTIRERLAPVFEREGKARSKLLASELRLETSEELRARLGAESSSHMNREAPQGEAGTTSREETPGTAEVELPAVNLSHVIERHRTRQTTTRNT